MNARPGEELEPELGWHAPEVRDEFPDLCLLVAELQLDRSRSLTGPSPPAIKGRLRELSNRWRGAQAVTVRRQPVPAAYRVFYRHIGLDPDVQRTPIEAAVLERMVHGGFLSDGLLADVLTIALVDTGVPVWALDADTLDGDLGLRVSREREALGRSGDAVQLPGGRLVVADSSTALALIFGELAAGHTPQAGSRRLTLFALRVAGVSTLHVEEALWRCGSTLTAALSSVPAGGR